MLEKLVLLAALAAAPVQLDLEALKAGRLPIAGTKGEADTCAALTTYMFMALSGSDQLSEEEKKTQLVYPSKVWISKAAKLRRTSDVDYMNEDSVTAAIISLAEIPSDRHFDLHRLCLERLKAGTESQ